nr:FeoB small GTPase domain-containing protein [Paenimyroides ceti]
MKETIKVALIGNPNVGKILFFNSLTGLNQRVANYPGITVERKTGKASFKKILILISLIYPEYIHQCFFKR